MIVKLIVRNAALFMLALSVLSGASLDPGLKKYVVSNTSMTGDVTIAGTESLAVMTSHWVKGFCRHHPDAQLAADTRGSDLAIDALIKGQVNIAIMSRKIKKSEAQAFKSRNGHGLIQLPVSIDMIVICVHKNNPIKSLTLQQLDDVFSRSRKITTWGQLGLKGDFQKKVINKYGHMNRSDISNCFKAEALSGHDFDTDLKQREDLLSLSRDVAKDTYGITYTTSGMMTPELRSVSLGVNAEHVFEAIPEHAYAGDYPLTRFLWLTVNTRPKSGLGATEEAFLRYVYSRDGQSDVLKAGTLPISAAVAQNSLSLIGLK